MKGKTPSLSLSVFLFSILSSILSPGPPHTFSCTFSYTFSYTFFYTFFDISGIFSPRDFFFFLFSFTGFFFFFFFFFSVCLVTSISYTLWTPFSFHCSSNFFFFFSSSFFFYLTFSSNSSSNSSLFFFPPSTDAGIQDCPPWLWRSRQVRPHRPICFRDLRGPRNVPFSILSISISQFFFFFFSFLWHDHSMTPQLRTRTESRLTLMVSSTCWRFLTLLER